MANSQYSFVILIVSYRPKLIILTIGQHYQKYPMDSRNINQQVEYHQLCPDHFASIIALGNQVHGDNYLDHDSLTRYYHRGIFQGINASWVALLDGQLIGFRLTFAPSQWKLDEWCTTDDWPVSSDKVCYFKCNTVSENCRGLGVGSTLLQHSINSVKAQGGLAGVAHIWAESPGNSAFKYFSKCGGSLIKKHPRKWDIHCIEDNYLCPICGNRCYCTALEMMVVFNNV